MDVLEIIVLTALAIGGHVVWYGGWFLPILSITIQQEQLPAKHTFLKWVLTFLVAAPTFGLIFYFAGPHLFSRAIPIINNLFLIFFGLWMLIHIVRTNTPVGQSQMKKIVSIIAIVQAVLVWQVIAGVYSITSEPTSVGIAVAIICFTIVTLVQTTIINVILWLIASTSRTKKLQRYLAGLFSFLCIVIGILNFL